MRSSKLFVKFCVLILFLTLISVWLSFQYVDIFRRRNYVDIGQAKALTKSLKKYWHDNEPIEVALTRKGIGKLGSPVSLDNYSKSLYKEYGYNAVLSDQISVNRSVPDVRPEKCKTMQRLANLPTTTVIITFFNERLSVLLRTLHGIVNRSPKELINEIIIIDDCSTTEDLQSPLDEYLRIYLQNVLLIRLPKRAGLIVARMIGARAASKKSEVLIFLDSHFEMNYNWLPPLLEPIALNPKTVTCPAFDIIDFESFEYTKNEPWRGYFDWQLNYMFFPLRKLQKEPPEKNYYEYVMGGGAIAINAQFFWNLGGFDEGMQLWGGDQFELSFKVWMCGGEVILVPCSRMAHIFRDATTNGNTNLYGNYSFLHRNLRRVIDVWFDDKYRYYVFNRFPELKDISAGNLTDRIAIRNRLNCKSLSWMMQNVMYELEDIFPPIEPKPLAEGVIRSMEDRNLCVATLSDSKKIILKPCRLNNSINGYMKWTYNFLGHIRNEKDYCFESDPLQQKLSLSDCFEVENNQRWYYDRKNKWIAQVENNICLAAKVEKRLVRLETCDRKKVSQKWIYRPMYQAEMDKWESKLNWSSKPLV